MHYVDKDRELLKAIDNRVKLHIEKYGYDPDFHFFVNNETIRKATGRTHGIHKKTLEKMVRQLNDAKYIKAELMDESDIYISIKKDYLND